MSEEKRLMIENDLCMNKSKAQVIKLYLDLTEQYNKEIEEPQKHKIPEKIEYHQVRRNEVEVDYIEDGIVKHFCLNKKQRYFADKINEILDYLEKIE